MGKGCVCFKSLEDLALDVVRRTGVRVFVEDHIANYRAARALMGKGRNAGEGAPWLSKSSAKKGAKKSAVKKAKPKKRLLKLTRQDFQTRLFSLGRNNWMRWLYANLVRMVSDAPCNTSIRGRARSVGSLGQPFGGGKVNETACRTTVYFRTMPGYEKLVSPNRPETASHAATGRA
jgi:hypothetical protein